MSPTYRVFTRTWWQRNPAYPGGLEPRPGRQHTIRRGLSYSEAQAFCASWNAEHKPGKLSRKAEFQSE